MTHFTDREPLFGWKAIAQHLNSSVRSVQRWQRSLGLPTHRVCLQPRKHTPVFAFTDELDDWVASRPRLSSELEQLRKQVAQLCKENAALRKLVGSTHRSELSSGFGDIPTLRPSA